MEESFVDGVEKKCHMESAHGVVQNVLMNIEFVLILDMHVV